MSGPVMVLNCGSATVKMALFDPSGHHLIASATAEHVNGDHAGAYFTRPDHQPLAIDEGGGLRGAVSGIITAFQQKGWLAAPPGAIGHRVVHGGEDFRHSTRITPQVLEAIQRCIPLAPLHNPVNLEGIRLMAELYPQAPQVAVFDTAFHQTLDPRAYLYAVPMDWYRKHQVRRYGFHGTSQRYILQETARRLARTPETTSLICAHLGNGCSITAVHEGRSRDTSMGFTPLEGLVMGSRCGDLDPGLFDYLTTLGMTPAQINEDLNHHSGLLGLSGLSNDMRELEKAAADGHAGASLAIDVFCFRLARYIGAMMVSVPRLDALVFTAGIGENSARIRSLTLGRLASLGFGMDEAANAGHGFETGGLISGPDSHRVMVIPTDEAALIARDTMAITGSPPHQIRREQP